MNAYVPAVALGFVSTCLVAAGGVGVVLADAYERDGIRYGRAMILREGSRAFEWVSTGLDSDMIPALYRDSLGLVIEARSLGGARAVVRWSGTAFRPGAPALGGARGYMNLDVPNVLSMPDGTVLRYGAARIWIGTPDGHPLGSVIVPPAYRLRQVVAAGAQRALLIPREEETRTFLLDLRTRTLAPGPATPPWMSTLAASDAVGTAVLLPGERGRVFRLRRLVIPATILALGAAGFAALTSACRRARWSAAGGVVGVVLGLAALAVGYVACVHWIREGLLH